MDIDSAEKINTRALLAPSFTLVLLLLTLVNIPVARQAEQRELHGLFESSRVFIESAGRLAGELQRLVNRIMV